MLGSVRSAVARWSPTRNSHGTAALSFRRSGFARSDQPSSEAIMTIGIASTSDTILDRSPAWGAVLAMALCCTVLVASEFMPVSLLTPIASDLHMTEGQAGQAISVSGVFAVLTSLFISGMTAGRDRRSVLLALTLLMIVSGSVVALAPNYATLMAGRAVLGIAIGGFWSMSTAAVMRPRAGDHPPPGVGRLPGRGPPGATGP